MLKVCMQVGMLCADCTLTFAWWVLYTPSSLVYMDGRDHSKRQILLCLGIITTMLHTEACTRLETCTNYYATLVSSSSVLLLTCCTINRICGN